MRSCRITAAAAIMLLCLRGSGAQGGGAAPGAGGAASAPGAPAGAQPAAAPQQPDAAPPLAAMPTAGAPPAAALATADGSGAAAAAPASGAAAAAAPPRRDGPPPGEFPVAPAGNFTLRRDDDARPVPKNISVAAGERPTTMLSSSPKPQGASCVPTSTDFAGPGTGCSDTVRRAACAARRRARISGGAAAGGAGRSVARAAAPAAPAGPLASPPDYSPTRAALPLGPPPPPQEACCATTNTCFDKTGGCAGFAARCPLPDCGKDLKFAPAECPADVRGRGARGRGRRRRAARAGGSERQRAVAWRRRAAHS
jgi:hypothetical protein